MKSMKLVLTALALAAAAAAPTAQAAPTLELSDGITTVTCADGAACDTFAAVGVVSWSGTIGAFSVNVSTGIAGGAGGGGTIMDLNSVNVAPVSPAGGTLTIKFSDQGFTTQGMLNGLFGGTLTGAGASVSASLYADAGNALLQETTLLGALGPFAPGAFSGAFTTAPMVGTYSLTQKIVLVAPARGMTYSGDFGVTPVPEPSGLALTGAALLALALVRRRRA